MSITKQTIELFYDVVSPYSWIAFEELCRYRTKWNIDLKLRPFFLGGIMQSSGNKPPASVPAKGDYMVHDISRLRRFYHIPVNFPANVAEVLFVKGSLAAQRFLTAVQITKPELVEPLSRELWMRIWSRDEDIASLDSLRQAGRKIGLLEPEIDGLIDQSKGDSVKNRLKQVTQEALDAGAFGAPTIIVHDLDNTKNLVFGSDRMLIIAMLLGEQYVGPLTELAPSKL